MSNALIDKNYVILLGDLFIKKPKNTRFQVVEDTKMSAFNPLLKADIFHEWQNLNIKKDIYSCYLFLKRAGGFIFPFLLNLKSRNESFTPIPASCAILFK